MTEPEAADRKTDDELISGPIEIDTATTGFTDPQVPTSNAAATARRIRKSRIGRRPAVVVVVLSALGLLLATAAGYLRWVDTSLRDADRARVESVHAARESTVALLSYQSDTVEKDLGAARDLLTGRFRDDFIELVNTVVIPSARSKKIAASAQVPAAASVSADPNRAVVLVFVNQTTVIGSDPPTTTPSSVRVTMQKVDDRWLISEFDPT